MDDPQRNRTVVGVWLALLVALSAVAVVSSAEEAPEPPSRATERVPAPARDGRPAVRARERTPARAVTVEQLASRVERVRGLRFRRRPMPLVVSPEQARREGLEDLDRSWPAARRRADEQVLVLLGLLEPGTDLRDVTATVLEDQVAGYYDPRSGRLRVVRGTGTANPFLRELTLAHELVHALEDQRFGLDMDETGSDDAELARLALVEGTATAAMLAYAQRHASPQDALGALQGLPGDAGTAGLPPFVVAQLLFPYEAGQAFVEDLRRRAGGRWSLVDLALDVRPPATTEQVLHPDRYIAAEPAARVRVRAADALGRGWRRVLGGTLGEWATGMVLGGGADAAGWGGDRYELWRGPGGDAAIICRWRWDDARGLQRFGRRLRRAVAARTAPGRARVARRGDVVTLAVAPDAGTAARLAGAP